MRKTITSPLATVGDDIAIAVTLTLKTPTNNIRLEIKSSAPTNPCNN